MNRTYRAIAATTPLILQTWAADQSQWIRRPTRGPRRAQFSLQKPNGVSDREEDIHASGRPETRWGQEYIPHFPLHNFSDDRVTI
jgi:hypothetical protein